MRVWGLRRLKECALGSCGLPGFSAAAEERMGLGLFVMGHRGLWVGMRCTVLVLRVTFRNESSKAGTGLQTGIGRFDRHGGCPGGAKGCGRAAIEKGVGGRPVPGF